MTKTLTEQIVHIQNDFDVVFADVVKLEKKLAIATKALKEMVGYPPTNFNECETYMWAAQQALKEMEGVK